MSKKLNITYLGPTYFRHNVWTTLAKYVYSDLFNALNNKFNISIISNPMPSHAQEGRQYLKKNFNVKFYEIPSEIDQEERIRAVSNLCAKIKPDVITNVFDGGTKWGHAASVVAFNLGVKGIPRVSGNEIASFIAQGMITEGSDIHKNLLVLERESFTKAHTVITMSPWEQRRCQSIIEDHGKIKVCMRGVDLEKFSFNKNSLRRVKKISYIGRNSLEKGYFLIENAAEKIINHSQEIKFLFAGNFQPHREKNKVYTGYIDSEKLDRYYDSIDAIALPSITEGMPQVICEAMAKGKPVIVSKHIFQGYLTHGKNAILTKLSINDLVKSIYMLNKDTILSEEISVQGRNFAEENFDKNIWNNIYYNIMTN